MMKGPMNLQDTFLNLARKDNVEVIIYLINGAQVRGRVKGFDNYTILLESNGKMQMVYKHAVSTVIPTKRLPNVYTESLRDQESPDQETGPEVPEEEGP